MSKMKEAMHDTMEKKIRHFQTYWQHKGMIRAAEHVERFPCADLHSKRKLERVGAMLRRKADELRHGKAQPERLVAVDPDELTVIEKEAWTTMRWIFLFLGFCCACYYLWKLFGGAA